MVKILIKNRFASMFSSLTTKEKNGRIEKAGIGKAILIGFVFLYLIFAVGFLSVSSFLSLAVVLLPDNSWLYFAIMILAALSLIFIFSIFETKTELFECKDNDLLLSMPIRPSDIIASRVSVVLIYNYIETLLIVLPAIVIYGIFTSDIIGIIGAFLVSLFVPLLATALASAVGYLVALISKRIKKNSFVAVAAFIVFFVGYLWGIDALTTGLDNMMSEDAEIVIPDIPVLRFIGASALLEPASLAAIIAVCVGAAAIAYYLVSRSYISIVTSGGGERRAVYKGEYFEKGSAISALTKKEIRKFLSSSNYMLNAGSAIIMQLIVGVLLLVNADGFLELGGLMLEEGIAIDISGLIAPVLIALHTVVLSTGMISASAMSLEGNNLWIIKSIPVAAKDVLISKALPQIIITTPFSIVTSVMLIIASRASFEYWLFFILVPIMANIAFAFFGIVINVALPKFKYENEAQVIKQSLAGFIVMFSQMLFSMGLMVPSFLLGVMGLGIVSAVISLGVFLGLAILFYLILTNVSVKKYNRFEA